MKVVVLGAGLVGTPMALDLHADEGIEVVLADINNQNLERARLKGVQCVQADLMQVGVIEELVSEADYVINALPGSVGYSSLKRAIAAGKSGVDIAFYPEDFTELQNLAIEKNVCWIVDMGVAPGMSNLLSAYGTTQLDQTDDIKIYVGGLPKDTTTYWQYKAPFSPSDVLEEYTRPARFIKDNELVTMPALTDIEILEFPVVGKLEAFNSDGLRSLMYNLKVPNMIEKTLRYPGYTQKVEVLKECGLFSTEDVIIDNQKINPMKLTSSLLFDQWKLNEGEREFTVMQIRVSGLLDGESKTIIYDMYDEYDPNTKIHSMARTTGYTATVVLRMMMQDRFKLPGVHAPEMLAFDSNLVLDILGGLKERGVVYNKSIC